MLCLCFDHFRFHQIPSTGLQTERLQQPKKSAITFGMILGHAPVSLGFSACPKRNGPSSDPLQFRWHLAKRTPLGVAQPSRLPYSATRRKFFIRVPFVSASSASPREKHFFTLCPTLSRMSHHFPAPESRLFRRNSLISHFPPQSLRLDVPPSRPLRSSRLIFPRTTELGTCPVHSWKFVPFRVAAPCKFPSKKARDSALSAKFRFKIPSVSAISAPPRENQ
jgi:hypothetical protein